MNSETFRDFFTEYYADDLRKLSAPYRRQQLRKLFIIIVFFVAMIIGIRMFLPFIALVVMFFGLLLYFLVFGNRRRRIDTDDELRRLMIRCVLRASNKPSEIQSHRHIPKSDFTASKIFGLRPDFYSGTELLKWERCKLSFIEAHEKRDIFEKDFSGPEHFQGILMQLRAGALPNSSLLMLPDPFRQDYKAEEGNLAVVPESGFQQKYSVWTSDKTSLNRLLSGPLGTIFKNLKEEVGLLPAISISNPYVYTALPFKDKLYRVGLLDLKPNFKSLYSFYCFVKAGLELSESEIDLART